jgi:DNA-binding HxlR family transcriptional regulator
VEYALSKMGIVLGPSMEALIDWAFVRCDVLGGLARSAGASPAAQPSQK